MNYLLYSFCFFLIAISTGQSSHPILSPRFLSSAVSTLSTTSSANAPAPTAAFATRSYWVQYLPASVRTHLLPPLPQSWARRLSLFPPSSSDSYTDASSAPNTPSRPSSSWTRRFSLFSYAPVPSGSFADDAAAGLHSSNFDLAGNIESGDARSGLDEQGKKEVLAMMRGKGVGFDEARRLVMQEKFRRSGVGSDGVPRDPKFVSFS